MVSSCRLRACSMAAGSASHNAVDPCTSVKIMVKPSLPSSTFPFSGGTESSSCRGHSPSSAWDRGLSSWAGSNLTWSDAAAAWSQTSTKRNWSNDLGSLGCGFAKPTTCPWRSGQLSFCPSDLWSTSMQLCERFVNISPLWAPSRQIPSSACVRETQPSNCGSLASNPLKKSAWCRRPMNGVPSVSRRQRAASGRLAKSCAVKLPAPTHRKRHLDKASAMLGAAGTSSLSRTVVIASSAPDPAMTSTRGSFAWNTKNSTTPSAPASTSPGRASLPKLIRCSCCIMETSALAK
mmetsp:Transcript_19388/g.58070  ORF Transcript_19388/g.58070 Transcript_19388/m.58070 type:complete len:292 (+) Transcript_19388:1024-1899(+)